MTAQLDKILETVRSGKTIIQIIPFGQVHMLLQMAILCY